MYWLDSIKVLRRTCPITHVLGLGIRFPGPALEEPFLVHLAVASMHLSLESASHTGHTKFLLLIAILTLFFIWVPDDTFPSMLRFVLFCLQGDVRSACRSLSFFDFDFGGRASSEYPSAVAISAGSNSCELHVAKIPCQVSLNLIDTGYPFW